jgi:3-deoxy-D-manno-octulosonic-acid transferase
MNLRTKLYSEINSEDYDVCIINNIGLLPDFYKDADLAFVGGSLVPRGGHNLIEPAMLGTPIIVGNHTFNFEEIVEEFVSHDSCIVIHNENELLKGMQAILDDSNLATRLSENAVRVVELNQGSTHTQVSYILKELGEET